MQNAMGGILSVMAFLMLGGSCLADALETDHVFLQAVEDGISSEKSLAVAGTNYLTLSREHSNAPPFLGKLEMAMALRYSTQGSQPDRIIEHCEAALRYPLDFDDARRLAIAGRHLPEQGGKAPFRRRHSCLAARRGRLSEG